MIFEQLCKNIATAITMGIKAWMEQTELPKIVDGVPNASNTMKKAFKEQTAIGWNQIFRGRISEQWGHMINYAIENNKQKQKYSTSETWGRDLITIAFRAALAMWIEQNKIEHGDSKEETHDILKTKLMQQVYKIQTTTLGQSRRYTILSITV